MTAGNKHPHAGLPAHQRTHLREGNTCAHVISPVASSPPRFCRPRLSHRRARPPPAARRKDRRRRAEACEPALALLEADRREDLQRAERAARRHQRDHPRQGRQGDGLCGRRRRLPRHGRARHPRRAEQDQVRERAGPHAHDQRDQSAGQTTDRRRTTRTGASHTAARAATEQWYPDHGMLNATKDQLKAMPQFKYSSYN